MPRGPEWAEVDLPRGPKLSKIDSKSFAALALPRGSKSSTAVAAEAFLPRGPNFSKAAEGCRCGAAGRHLPTGLRRSDPERDGGRIGRYIHTLRYIPAYPVNFQRTSHVTSRQGYAKQKSCSILCKIQSRALISTFVANPCIFPMRACVCLVSAFRSIILGLFGGLPLRGKRRFGR